MALEVTLSGFNRLVTAVNLSFGQPVVRKDIFNAVGANLLQTQQQRFLQATDPDGIPWPVSRAAIRRKASGRGGKTLFDRGVLFRSIQFGIIDDETAEIGTDVPYARKHQFGEEGLPRREFLGFTQEDANSAAIIAAAVLTKHLEF